MVIYLCSGLNDAVVGQGTQIAPYITEGYTAFVHHVVIYLCSGLNDAVVGQGTECDSAHIDIQECRAGYLIGGWAVGGNVSPIFQLYLLTP